MIHNKKMQERNEMDSKTFHHLYELLAMPLNIIITKTLPLGAWCDGKR